MWNVPEKFKVILGGNTFINTPNLIVYIEEPLFRLTRSTSDGILGIDFDIYGAEGAKVATVRRAIIVDGDKNNYEMITGHEEYKVVERKTGRMIAAVRRRDVTGAELEVSVELYTKDGILFQAGPYATYLPGGNELIGLTIENCNSGITILEDGYIIIG